MRVVPARRATSSIASRCRPLAAASATVASRMRSLEIGAATDVTDYATSVSSVSMAEDGYFPRSTSVLRRVQEQRAVGLFYGQRALCIGALAPLNYVGTAEHTANRLTPFKRLAHTGKWFEAVMFGSRDDADRRLHAVARMHARVTGALSEPAGPYPAGTRYDALAPPLMLWTIAVMMDS